MTENYPVKILCVDDEEDILEILQAKISKLVPHVQICTDPLKAVEMVKTDCVDILISDLRMPGMDGLQMFAEMKKTLPKLICIFLTGFGDKKSVQEALRLGAYDFVDKPFNERGMNSAIQRAIDKIKSDRMMRDILELFIAENSQLDFEKFDKLSFEEQEKTIKAALGLARMRITKMDFKRGK